VTTGLTPVDKIEIVWTDTIVKTAAFTKTEYQGFQQAYDFFNRELFDRSLPQVLVTLQRHAKSRGYFSPERFNGRIDETAVHELALNPDAFTGRTDELILSTLAHEMAHVWQQTYGKPPRKGYHDRKWAEKMKEIGLQPSSSGEAGGAETGQSMTHYILPGGRFAKAYANLAAGGFELHWQSVPVSNTKKASKMKFTCQDCGQNAWAKPGAQLICGVCYSDGERDICLMLSEEQS
jgi:predicted SprT family Zn-dependent metalloprotease